MSADRAIRAATAAVVLAVAAFAAIVSYSHIYELGHAYGQSGTAARLLPLSVDGLIVAASLVMLHEARYARPAPMLARAMLGLGVAATIGANMAYGATFGTIGAIISAWPAVAFVGSAELLMTLIRAPHRTTLEHATGIAEGRPVPPTEDDGPPAPPDVPSLEQAVQERHADGASQRAIARELNIDRRKVKQIIDQAAA